MKEAEIYVYSAVNTVKPSTGFGAYLLAFKKADGSPYTVDRFCVLKDGSKNLSEPMLIATALRHFKDSCRITIHLYSYHSIRVISEWLPLWKERGWYDSAGKELSPWYRILEERLSGHEVTATAEKGEFTTWLRDNTNQKIKKGEKGCLISLENLIPPKSSTDQPKA